MIFNHLKNHPYACRHRIFHHVGDGFLRNAAQVQCLRRRKRDRNLRREDFNGQGGGPHRKTPNLPPSCFT
ncbi:MAG: hypothetical protein K9J37_13420 [Saprospiraceae bacterium]|nr:hypothetical protein [Saprospiraceae bacterium]MCF8250908.1 hypothetical protein [Saprospiraceae bacterium]MCF8282705.1 hypothetical protein [Bacteroidales bacterium]MCF8311873.1 hypothetical protein [Saprospiraceae bacterium]MCF8443013.1 hypothetical protein [Saprospiraceae bacterium]